MYPKQVPLTVRVIHLLSERLWAETEKFVDHEDPRQTFLDDEEMPSMLHQPPKAQSRGYGRLSWPLVTGSFANPAEVTDQRKIACILTCPSYQSLQPIPDSFFVVCFHSPLWSHISCLFQSQAVVTCYIPCLRDRERTESRGTVQVHLIPIISHIQPLHCNVDSKDSQLSNPSRHPHTPTNQLGSHAQAFSVTDCNCAGGSSMARGRGSNYAYKLLLDFLDHKILMVTGARFTSIINGQGQRHNVAVIIRPPFG